MDAKVVADWLRVIPGGSRSQRRFLSRLLFSLLATLWLWAATASPSYSHWADLAAAEIVVNQGSAQVTLTFPTGLVAFADDNRDGQLQAAEIRTHQAELQRFLSDRISLTNDTRLKGILAVKPLEVTGKASGFNLQPSSHSTLILDYTWPQPVGNLQIDYNLFLPGVATASCQATILQGGQVTSFVFTPKNMQFSVGGNFRPWGWKWLLAIAGSIVWGAMHALSPGHGKTIVGAYLVGSRATPQHALLLALTTTITHTLGVFALGCATVFASKWISPEGLYPWLSLMSGLLVMAIGLNLASDRLRGIFRKSQPTVDLLSRGTWEREYTTVPAHSHSHGKHDHSHNHGHHNHSHLPPGVDGPVTWQSLVALGISGGLLPCPSALVMLLSATALGQAGFGLTLVLAFSLGLAGVLTAIGLILVYARRIFEQMQIFKYQETIGFVRALPTVSAVCVMLLGLGLTGQAAIAILYH